LATRILATPLQGSDHLIHLIGNRDESLKAVGKAFGVKIRIASEGFLAEGQLESVEGALNFFDDLSACVEDGYRFQSSEVATLAKTVAKGKGLILSDLVAARINLSLKNRHIIPKSETQKQYIEAIRDFDCVFGVGPAGTGKTYLAMAMAVSGLLDKAYSRIILTRPIVEAGERLGFLPGDLQEKINPYLRPLFDALHDMVDFERVERLLERGEIEVAPLAYMRGRSLNDSFIILDEAQNTTPEQMKMFLTRLGTGSKAVITGDITQSDLPAAAGCGLINAREVLDGLDAVRFVDFSERDVIRTELVRKIVRAYEAHQD
jgi:phosphate starvation-inducible PhoH-like protein